MDDPANAEKSSTEEKILEAAKRVFQRKGYDGTKMSDIAKEAGINQALLHYYYRNKDRLFQSVYHHAILTLFPKITDILNTENPLEEKIRLFVDTYYQLLSENPFLPVFIMHEMSSHPERIKKFFTSHHLIRPKKMLEQYREGVKCGKYFDMEPEQFFVNLIALCVIPFAAKPVIQTALGMDDAMYSRFIQVRQKQLADWIIHGMKKR